MKTLNFIVLIFFVIISIKISVQLELILIRLKRFHLNQNEKNNEGIDQLKKINKSISSLESNEEASPGELLDT